MFKRVALFLATNLAVLALVSVVMSVLGVNAAQFSGLLVMAALFGFGGSIVSLLMSKWVAKRFTGAQVIEAPRNEAEQWLVSTVQRQAQKAGIGMGVRGLQTNLLDQFAVQIGDETPDLFLIDIQQDQAVPLRHLLDERVHG